MKKLAFKDGYAIIVKGIQESASEYGTDSKYNIEVVFRTAVGIKRFAEYAGSWVMDRDTKKYLLERKKNSKQVSFHARRVPLENLPTETHPFWYEKTGVGFFYENHYTGEHFSTVIPTTRDGLKNKKKEREFLDLYKNAMTGSCAGGQSFKDVADSYACEKNVISSRY